MTADDTIYAVSSGSGPAAIAVVRVSGRCARLSLAELARVLPPRRFSVVSILDPESGELLDRAIGIWLPGPATYTGEDSVEFHVHAGRATLAAVLAALGKLPGYRLAEPGEFTRRAFINGKMDLVEAEGLSDLLVAQTARQRQLALSQMQGQASSVFESWRKELVLARAGVEAVLDFADEPGVADVASLGIQSTLAALLSAMRREFDRSSLARTVRHGVKIVLAGLPNTGKSSLLNAIAGREAAIVSSVPGTTRDVIEVHLEIAGMAVILTDTAGLRKTADVIEEEGVRRTEREARVADIVVWVTSTDVEGSSEVWPGVQPDMMVQSKCDEVSGLRGASNLALSALTGAGMDDFLAELSNLIQKRYEIAEPPAVTTERQRAVLENSIRFVNDAIFSLSSGLELAAEDLRKACEEIGRLTGKTDVEEWLGVIFSRFCIGK